MGITEEGITKIALAGNPNVGKSTVFNALTGLKQHTGNWAGKTVLNAEGNCTISGREYRLVDIPGTYSLIAHSHEEEVAADYICFGNPSGVIVVCDAGCLERNLNLAIQILEVTGNVIVCVNLIDEAEKAGIRVDKGELEKSLGCPVVLTAARNKKGLNELCSKFKEFDEKRKPLKIDYGDAAEAEIEKLIPFMPEGLNKRWCAARLLEGCEHVSEEIYSRCEDSQKLRGFVQEARERCTIDAVPLLYEKAKNATKDAVKSTKERSKLRMKVDKLLTGKFTGIPLMILLLALVFYITVTLANYPSELLSDGLFYIGDRLKDLLILISAPGWLIGMLIDGVYRVLAWVVAVMLPPMAIFFPLFTLLEDAGYLPRVAFNMDSAFKKCSACGKQSLTMAMGLGCNAAGVTGCRIIDSPRERYIAIITNAMMPCNGRFPAMITLITLFIAAGSKIASALCLTGVLVIGVAMTFFGSWLLSKTFLKGTPSSFTLELPPFRRPKIGEVLVRSLIDRTLFVLKRAVLVAAPAGLVMWLMANVQLNGQSILAHCSNFLDPVGRVMGLDGVILVAFILGLPANEIVIPIAVMAYTAAGTIVDPSMAELSAILVQNGWTVLTAVCTILFSLLHWPCSTTLITIKKETGSMFYTVLSALLPTLFGVTLCILINLVFGVIM